MRERDRKYELAEGRGLRPLSYETSSDVWVSKDQDTGIFPNHFYITRYGENEEVVFDEHRIEFPKDPSQLSEFLGALNVLYSGFVGRANHYRNDPTEFIEFVNSLVEPKQPKV